MNEQLLPPDLLDLARKEYGYDGEPAWKPLAYYLNSLGFLLTYLPDKEKTTIEPIS